MTTNEQQSWTGMCFVPAFVECPRTGFLGEMLDAIFGVRTKPNPSKFAGKIVYVNQNGVVVSVDSPGSLGRRCGGGLNHA
jgi:hypothetical protein